MAYLGRQPNTGVRSRYIFTATASQTTFSGSDDDGKTLKYEDAAYLDVFLNGVLLKPVTDYTATSKTSVVLTSGAAVSDIVEIVAYDIASIADTVSKANGGTFDAGVAANNRVGIGTTSPSVNAEIRGSASNGQMRLGGSTAGTYASFYSDNDGVLVLGADAGNNSANSYLGFEVDGSEAARFDSSGNFKVSNGTIYLDDNGSHNGIINAPASLFVNIDSDNTSGGEDFIIGSDRTSTSGGKELLRMAGGEALTLTNTKTGTTSSAMVFSNSVSGGAYRVRFDANSSIIGDIRVTTSSVAYNTTSDARLKENVVDLDGAIDRVKQIPVHRFNFIANPDETVDGFLAHEVQSIVPEAVTGTQDEVDEDGNPVYQGIDQSKLVPLLTAAIKEQQALIEDLQTRLAALENA